MGKKNLELYEHLESNEIPEIKEADDDKVLNEKLVKTVNYLLRHIKELSRNALSTADEREKKKIFSFFGKDIAQTACDFYQESKEFLDPVTLNGEIGQRLKNATQEVTKINSLMESIEKANADLLKKEKELNEKNETYKKMEENIFRLKKIKETITEEAFNKLKQEHAEFDLHFGENSNIVKKMKEYGISGIDNLLIEVNHLKDSLEKELTRFDNIIKNVIEELEKEKEDIGRRNKTLN